MHVVQDVVELQVEQYTGHFLHTAIAGSLAVPIGQLEVDGMHENEVPSST
jgi:hypothetical protein